jgi:hypothetical protein
MGCLHHCDIGNAVGDGDIVDIYYDKEAKEESEITKFHKCTNC